MGDLSPGLVGSDGADKILRVAMALETPAHAERLGLVDRLHVIDLAVATHATDAAVHVRRVVEVGVVGHVVDFHPGDRLPGGPAIADRLELRVVLLHVCEWQFMQVCVAGTLEWPLTST